MNLCKIREAIRGDGPDQQHLQLWSDGTDGVVVTFSNGQTKQARYWAAGNTPEAVRTAATGGWKPLSDAESLFAWRLANETWQPI